MKAKEIVLLILIIAGGIFFYYAETGKLDISFEIDDHFFSYLHQFKYEDSQVLEPPFPARLKIINSHGDIEIQGTSEERISISFQKRIWRKNEKQAKEVSDALKMTVERDPQQVLISTNRKEFRRRNFETNFKISLPESMEVEVENSYGQAKLLRVGKASIINSHGKVIASEISGELTAKNSYEDVEIENVQGDCQLESKHSDVLISDVRGKAEVNHAYGKIDLKNISQEVKVEGSHSEVYGRNLMGAAELETSYEKIVLFDVGPAKITGIHSEVEVEGARESIHITDNYSRVKVNSLQGNLIVSGRNLEIYGKGVVAQEISLISSNENIELSEFSGKVIIKNSHGEILLQPLPLTHPIEVEAEYADIMFSWPQGGKYPFEARAKYGEIKWNLPVELSFHQENHVSTIKAFVEESGNPSITLSTSYGTIRVE